MGIDDFQKAVNHLRQMKASQLHLKKSDHDHTKGYMAALNDINTLIQDWKAQTNPENTP